MKTADVVLVGTEDFVAIVEGEVVAIDTDPAALGRALHWQGIEAIRCGADVVRAGEDVSAEALAQMRLGLSKPHLVRGPCGGAFYFTDGECIAELMAALASAAEGCVPSGDPAKWVAEYMASWEIWHVLARLLDAEPDVAAHIAALERAPEQARHLARATLARIEALKV